ncbi:MAG: glucosaminidase domain-containing protein [Chitinophagales bacterium]
MKNLPICLTLLLLFSFFCFSFTLRKVEVFSPTVPLKAVLYVQKYQLVAVEEMHRMGIPASIKLAQGMLESNYGESKLAQKAYNHFGLKCKEDWTGASMEYTDDETNECFRAYYSDFESFHDHSNFLRYHYRAFYDDLFDSKSKDYAVWAKGLEKGGYANNPNYANSLINIVERYELQRLDKLTVNEAINYNHVFPLKIERDSLLLFDWLKGSSSETISQE